MFRTAGLRIPAGNEQTGPLNRKIREIGKEL